jgi:hypothetical protein
MDGVRKGRISPQAQQEIKQEIYGEYLRGLMGALADDDISAGLRIMGKTERLAGAYADLGYASVHHVQARLELLLAQVHRAGRRYLIRRYLTNRHAVGLDELNLLIEMLEGCSVAERAEDIAKVRATMAEPRIPLCDDIEAEARRITMATARLVEATNYPNGRDF